MRRKFKPIPVSCSFLWRYESNDVDQEYGANDHEAASRAKSKAKENGLRLADGAIKCQMG